MIKPLRDPAAFQDPCSFHRNTRDDISEGGARDLTSSKHPSRRDESSVTRRNLNQLTRAVGMDEYLFQMSGKPYNPLQ